MKHLHLPPCRRQRHHLDEYVLDSVEDPHMQLIGTLSIAYMHVILPLVIILAILGAALNNIKGMVIYSIPGGDLLLYKWRATRFQLRHHYGNMH